MSNPYVGLPPRAYWRSGVADVSFLEMQDVYRPRYEISRESTRIAAAGSCFAQHIGRQFKARGYQFVDVEKPLPMLPESAWNDYGFNMYSARYGNLYSARQLLQMFRRAHGLFTPEEDVWEKNGRFYDPFRPNIEKNGYATPEEVRRDRDFHLAAVRRILEQTDVFVFTFGLTEAWECIADGAILPTCPGTVAGQFDPEKYRFVNFSYEDVLGDFTAFKDFAEGIRPGIRFLITVSPVPLTATASDQHVLPATVYSKSVLRTVCGTLYQKYENVDYFPSFELVSSHPGRAMFFRPNLREVSPVGVAHVMDAFFGPHTAGQAAPEPEPVSAEKAPARAKPRMSEDDLVCEEALLEEFGR
ncbi:GSCFA domain-containing protein [Salipiger thiooxidans]|uniref:GSCFA domain-containing protein n=1 Tax=Salipiger thiooxidans TaxID=282683 RepID=UPI001A8DD209|nr:GSCFA domain-containing protein [Salipiger thiooxidans]MBN8189910.1 GSCFA domain-containing protein [Salipiger thiooxidans]